MELIHDFISEWETYIRKNRRNKRRNQIMAMLIVLVVFCTTYALMVPAITMEKNCEIQEHTHSDACYNQVTSTTVRLPACTPESLEIHRHEAGCYGQDDQIVCGYGDFVLHRHDAVCYDDTGTLWCPLPEVEEYRHGDACYRFPEIHIHQDSCYTVTPGELTCGLHEHTAECMTEEVSLMCGMEESDGHQHTDACLVEKAVLVCGKEETHGHLHGDTCRNEDGEVICGEEERDGHSHTEECWDTETEIVCGLEIKDGHHHSDACYQRSAALSCGIESDHIHTEDCRSILRELTCGMEETGEDFSPEPELVCGKEEVIFHCHTEACFNEYRQLVCGQMQILQHQHDDGCFRVEEVPVDTETLTCTISEESQGHSHGPECLDASGGLICQLEETAGHQHTDRCYGTWELVCRIPEHTHGDACVSAAEPTETVTEETTETEVTVPTETAETVPESMLPDVGDSGLPVMGTAYGVNPGRRMRMLQQSGENILPVATDPVNVAGYITAAKLEYRTDSNNTWTEVNAETEIPGDATFKLTIDYAGIPIANLMAAGNTMTYTLPDIFREAMAEGSITDAGKNEIGTITASGTTATIAFKSEWLQNQQTSANTAIAGDFFVQGKVNLSAIPGEGNTTITIGNVNITLNFAGDLVAKYGNVDIEKTMRPTVQETETGDYLEYTLTVTAGADGCPDVSVEDIFTLGGQFLERDADGNPVIVVVSPEGTQVTVAQDKMTWNIGDMDPNTKKTLTYRVKLLDSYTGIKSPDNQEKDIQNTATVRSKNYERDTGTVTFKPKAGATLSKIGSNITSNPDGSLSITYYVWINAYADNNYVLDNVKLVDSLDGKGSQKWPTDENIRQHLRYKEDSFQLYFGGSKEKTDLEGLTPLEQPADALRWGEDSHHDNKHNDSFTYYAGSLAPGKSKTLVYQVTVEPGAFVAAGNNAFTIQNRAEIKSDDNRTDGNQWLNGWLEQNTLARKAWSRKLAGSELQQQETISMSDGNVYDTDGVAARNPGSFVVPAGSYRYQVLANEAGDWNLSAANLKDSLSAYMQFVGYVRVDAYYVDTNAPASSLSDSNALAYFQNKTPCTTFWMDINQQTQFTIKPTPQIVGSEHNNYAFLLTYYAQPVNTANITQVLVNNTFEISGTVGIGNYSYELVGISASAGVTVSGSNSFHADKQAWYYEPPQVSAGDFAKGAIYWAIQVDGNLIPANTKIRDITNANGGTQHFIHGNSLAGVYTGILGVKGIGAYRDLTALLASGKLTALESSAYSVEPYKNQLTITLTEDLQLGSGQSLYILVKTEPDALPQTDRDTKWFSNSLQSSGNGTNWVDHSGADLTLYGSENIFKELGRVFTYPGSGTEIKELQRGTQAAIHPLHLTGGGTYVAWQIHLNYEGTLNGTYRVLEQIPDGMEVAYIRTYWLGNKAVGQNPRPASVQITDLGQGWTECSKTMSSMNNIDYLTYYYVNGQQVLLEYQNLYPGGETDQHAVEIQVVCKVTDQDVLKGGQEKNFDNAVKLLNPEGQEIGSDANGVTLSAPQMSKKAGEIASVSGGKYPFVITLNELGTDLMPNADTITLVDELGPRLIMNTASIQVKNTSTNEVLTQGWSSSVEKEADGTQTLKIVLPDNLPLTVTYTATVNAPPGQTVTVSNNAHWEGYTTTQGGSVNDSSYQYEAGGTAGSMTTPQIKIHKIDQYNNQLNLKGAEFSLTKMKLENNQLQEDTTDSSLTGTTDENGMLTFGADGNHLLAYNQIYRILETKAPEGYLLDSVPKYVLIAQKIQLDGTKVYPDYYQSYEEAGVYISYGGPEYTYEAENHKGEIAVTKCFENVDGSSVTNLSGTYWFGLFTDEEGTKMQKSAYVTFKNGMETVSAKFTNVELDCPYYVYELDDQGKAITGGSATVSGIPFVTSYSPQGSVTVTAQMPSASVTVTNRLNYAELPSTGGRGTWGFYIPGAILLSAAVLYYLKKRNCLIP